MKTIKILFLMLIIPGISFAHYTPKTTGQKANKIIARKVIKRTAIVIMHAHKKVKEGKVYTGELASAISHQKFARKLYKRGMYQRSIHHSRIARILAIRAIKANKATDVPEAKFTAEEEEQMKNAPGEEDLKKELEKEMPGEKVKDEEVITSAPDVDVSDSE